MADLGYAGHLLPTSATPLEEVLAALGTRVQAIPAPIDTVKRPLDVVPAFLPYDAWEFSVDVWDRDWPDTRKRVVAEASLRLHAKKGTAHCLKEYVRYAGGAVRRIVRPPQKIFSGPSLTREEREAWLSGLPQVRVWRIRDRVQAPAHKAFHGGKRRGLFVEQKFATPSTALQHLGRRARWVVDGVETEIRVSTFGSYFRLHIKGRAGFSVFSGKPVRRGRFYVPSTAKQRLVTIRPAARLPWRSPVGPSLRPVTAEPERVKLRGKVGLSVFSGRPLGGFFVPSSAGLRIFERYAVNDGRRIARRRPTQFMGGGKRFGWPAHTALVYVSVPGKRPRFAAGEGIVMPRRRFWLPHDPEPLRRVRRAIEASKRLSDRILVSTGVETRFVAGRPFFADDDSFIIGRPQR